MLVENRNPLRIAMIGLTLPRGDFFGGVSGQTHLLADAMARRGNEVTVYSLRPSAVAGAYTYKPVPLPEPVRARQPLAAYLAAYWISRIPLDGFDLVHAHGDDHFIQTRRPLVRTFYGAAEAEARSSTSLRRRLYHLGLVPFERLSERRATAVVVISEDTRRYLKRRATVIPCGYDPTVFFSGGPKSPIPSILFVGDLTTRKRGKLLVDAFVSSVMAEIPSAELWLVTTDRVNLPGVRWFGRVSNSRLAELYRQAWVFCMPSLYEGFGVPYVEALASGTAVVATPNGGALEVLEGGRWGSLVSDNHLGAELLRLLSDADARERMAREGLKRAKDYTIAEIADRYEKVYETVLSLPPWGTPV
jgi:phosphatidylinositol alpha-mannosyltransferase